MQIFSDPSWPPGGAGEISKMVQVNVNKDKTVTRQFRIMVIPTLVFFDAKGKEVGRTPDSWKK